MNTTYYVKLLKAAKNKEQRLRIFLKMCADEEIKANQLENLLTKYPHGIK